MDPVGGFQIVRVSGTLTGDEVLSTFRNLISAPEFNPATNVLLDITQVESFNFGYDVVSQVDAILKNVDALGIGHQMAIIADSDYLYGMARMFANIRSGSPQQVEVFRDEVSAKAWLTRR
jgi:hypothetical protein